MPSAQQNIPCDADKADKNELYQIAVQSPEADVELLSHIFRDIRGREAYHFREDFCGTGLTLSHWIRQGKEYSGEGFDINPEPIGWGKQHNFAPLGDGANRAVLHCEDARDPSLRAPDLRCAFNFSYWVFCERATMLDYFRRVYADLADDGLFVVDIHGGPESTSEDEYESDCNEDFSYVWHQHEFSPSDHRAKLALHFRFQDGSSIENAFTYEWRVWSIPEITDILSEAGFESITVYWEDQDEDGVGSGYFNKTAKGLNTSTWIACLAAAK